MNSAVDIIIIVVVLMLVSGVLFFMLRRKGHCSCDKSCGRRKPGRQEGASNGDQGIKSGGAWTRKSGQCMMCRNGCALMDAQNTNHSAQNAHHGSVKNS